MSSIDQVYKKLIPDLKDLEAYRLKKFRIIRNNRYFLLTFLSLSVLGTLFVILTDSVGKEDKPYVISAIFMFLLVELVVALFVYGINKSKYDDYFKKNVIERLVPALVPGVSYQYDNHVSYERFKECKLFRQEANKVDGSDYFFGKMGEMTFELSWLNIYNESYIRESGTKDFNQRRYRRSKGADLINGIFMVASLPFPVKSEINIIPSFHELGKLMKSVASSLNIFGKSDLPEVKMGNSDFQELFIVHCEDEILAKSAIEQSIMDEMVRIKKNNKAYQLYCSFIDHSVFVAIDGAKNMFRTHVNKSLLNPDSAAEIFKNLLEYISILKIFVSIYSPAKGN